MGNFLTCKGKTMSYEMFQRKAEQNSEFEVIPTKEKLYAQGVVFDENGYMKYDGLTYIPNMAKLASLPKKLQALFVEKKNEMTVYDQDVGGPGNALPTAPKTKTNLSDLNNILFEQLQKIVDPEKSKDKKEALKEATTVCGLAENIIKIADLSLRAEVFSEKKRLNLK